MADFSPMFVARRLLWLLGLTLALSACSEKAPPPAAPKPVAEAPKPPAPVTIQGDTVIVNRKPEQLVLTQGIDMVRALAVFEVRKSQQFPFTAWITAMNSVDYRALAKREAGFNPFDSTSPGYGEGRAKIFDMPVIAATPEVEKSFVDLIGKGRMKKPVILRLTGKETQATQYTLNGLKIGMAGPPASTPWLITRFERFE